MICCCSEAEARSFSSGGTNWTLVIALSIVLVVSAIVIMALGVYICSNRYILIDRDVGSILCTAQGGDHNKYDVVEDSKDDLNSTSAFRTAAFQYSAALGILNSVFILPKTKGFYIS